MNVILESHAFYEPKNRQLQDSILPFCDPELCTIQSNSQIKIHIRCRHASLLSHNTYHKRDFELVLRDSAAVASLMVVSWHESP